MSTRAKARMLTAYVWDCDDCGHENFVRAQVAEIVDEDREELFRKFHGMEAYEPLPDGWREFQMVTHPDIVLCRECEHAFDAIDDREELT